jgi:hypothetical protein
MEHVRDRTARGHEEPFAVQFSVFLANRVGQLHELLTLLGQKGVPVLGVSVVDSTDWAVIRTVLGDPAKGRQILRDAALPFTESEVLLVELSGRDPLAKAAGHLLQAEINVHFAYPLTVRSHDAPVIVLHVDDNVLAVELLRRHGFALLGHEDLADRA